MIFWNRVEAKISAVAKENAFRTSLFVTITETVKMAKMKTDVYQVSFVHKWFSEKHWSLVIFILVLLNESFIEYKTDII